MYEPPGVPPYPATAASYGAPSKGHGRLGCFVAAGAAILLVAALITTAIVAIRLVTGRSVVGGHDPGDRVPGPHRRAVPAPRHTRGEPRWTAPSHHWVGLSKGWSVDRGGYPDRPDYDLVSDGTRVIALREQDNEPGGSMPAVITGFDGATGKRQWSKRLPWAGDVEPVVGHGIMIIAVGKEAASGPADPEPAEYVALNTATGAERWRVRAHARTAGGDTPGGRAQPAGALSHGVFYYGDGHAVIGVDADTGRRRYRFTAKRYTGVSGPIAVGDKIAMLAERAPADGRGTDSVLLLRPDLTPVTTRRFPTHTQPTRMAANGDLLVVWNMESRIWVTDVRTGHRQWRRTVAGRRVTGVLGRTVVLSANDGSARLSGYDLLTGRKTWSTALPTKGRMDRFDVDLQDGTVFVLGVRVLLVDPATGKIMFQRWSHALAQADPASGRAVYAAGHLIVYDGKHLTSYT